jgi:very-short-patch-repair endonuclease
MGEKAAPPDQIVARIAARQHGVVTLGQLSAVGLSRNAVSRRCKAGRLHRLHRGVYAVGHPALSWQRKWMAAVLSGGDGAVLSHRSAAELWRLLSPRGGPVHISTPSLNGRDNRAGVRVHRRRSLPIRDRTERHGIPVTTPARTVADLRSTVPDAVRRRAIRQAEVQGYRTGLDEVLAPTRSELEDLFLRLCRRFRLPAPEVNVRVAGREVDFLWRGQRVVAETDGYRYHRGSVAFEDDHERDLELRAAGFAILRFTYRQVTTDPGRVARSIAGELAAAERRPAG